MIYEKVKIVRDSNTAYNRAMPAWEIPVVNFIFDAGNVQPTGVLDRVDRPHPSAEVEYDRLQRRYGEDTKSGVPYVTSIYGPGERGIANLQDAIDAAELEEQKQVRAGTAPKVKLADIPELVAMRDPLLA